MWEYFPDRYNLKECIADSYNSQIVFLIVTTSGNMFPAVVTCRNVFLLIITCGNTYSLMGHHNPQDHNGFLKDFYDLYDLKDLIKVPTNFKNLDFLTSIDVMLTTSYRNLHN